MSVAENLRMFASKLIEKKEEYNLYAIEEEFIAWYHQILVYENQRDFEFIDFEINNARNLMSKMAAWYELRYPESEIQVLFSNNPSSEEYRNLIGINKKIKEIYDMSNDAEKEYLMNLFTMVNNQELLDVKFFLNSLPEQEKWMLSRPKYPRHVNIDKSGSFRGHIHLTANGRIDEVEEENLYEKEGLVYLSDTINSLLIGKTISEGKAILTYFGIKLKKDNEIDRAIKNYEDRIKIKECVLNSVMYRLIDQGGNRIGPKRAFLFAKEFNRNIDIPMTYGLDYSDPHLRYFIQEYIKAGGRTDLECPLYYFSNHSRGPFEKTTINRALRMTSRYPQYTKEETGYHQRLTNLISQREKQTENIIEEKPHALKKQLN